MPGAAPDVLLVCQLHAVSRRQASGARYPGSTCSPATILVIHNQLCTTANAPLKMTRWVKSDVWATWPDVRYYPESNCNSGHGAPID